MCILKTELYACTCAVRTVTPCGSTSFSCGSTFVTTPIYHQCPDCELELHLGLGDMASHMATYLLRHEQRYGSSGGKWSTRGCDDADSASREGDFGSSLRHGNIEPVVRWSTLERTRDRRGEAEIRLNTQGDDGSSNSAPALAPLNVSELLSQSPRRPTSQAPSSPLSSLATTVSTPSIFADLESRNPNPRKRRRSSAYSPHSDDEDEDDRPVYTWRDLPPLRRSGQASCPLHEGWHLNRRCEDCRAVLSSGAAPRTRAADVAEDQTRADMKNRPTWKGYVPVAQVPKGEFEGLPKFDRRGVPIVDGATASAPATSTTRTTRSQTKRRRT